MDGIGVALAWSATTTASTFTERESEPLTFLAISFILLKVGWLGWLGGGCAHSVT